MLEAFKAKGVPFEKQLYFPNVAHRSEPPPSGHFRARYGFAAEDFLAIYSGNIGVKQGLQVLVRAATMLRERRIQVVICGDGAQRDLIAAQAEGLAQRANKFLYYQPLNTRKCWPMPTLAIMHVLRRQRARLLPESKLLVALASSRPVLGVADAESELARAIQESGCGITVPPNHPEELALTLDRLAAQPELLAGCAQAGRAWVVQFEPKIASTLNSSPKPHPRPVFVTACPFGWRQAGGAPGWTKTGKWGNIAWKMNDRRKTIPLLIAAALAASSAVWFWSKQAPSHERLAPVLPRIGHGTATARGGTAPHR